MISVEQLLSDNYLIDALDQEVRLMKNIKSPYVISLVDAAKTKRFYYLFTEYFNGASLDKLWEAKGSRFTEEETQVLLRQICLGLEYLASEGIAHRDIKLENIFIHFPNQ